MGTAVVMLAGLGCLLAYGPLQRKTLARLSGAWWLAAAAPVAGLAGFLVVLFWQGANLWPLSMMLAAALAGLWLMLLVTLRRVTCGSWF